MANKDTSERRQSEIADRVDRGNFDAAVRPTSNEESLGEGLGTSFRLVAEVARAQFGPLFQWDEFVQALCASGCGVRADRA